MDTVPDSKCLICKADGMFPILLKDDMPNALSRKISRCWGIQSRGGDLLCPRCFNNMQVLPDLSHEEVKATTEKETLPETDSLSNGRNGASELKRKLDDKYASDSTKATIEKGKLPKTDSPSNNRNEATASKRRRSGSGTSSSKKSERKHEKSKSTHRPVKVLPPIRECGIVLEPLAKCSHKDCNKYFIHESALMDHVKNCHAKVPKKKEFADENAQKRSSKKSERPKNRNHHKVDSRNSEKRHKTQIGPKPIVEPKISEVLNCSIVISQLVVCFHENCTKRFQNESTMLEHAKVCRSNECDSFKKPLTPKPVLCEPEKLPDASEERDDSNSVRSETFNPNMEPDKENACDISTPSIFLPPKTLDGNAVRSRKVTNTSTPSKKRKRIPAIGSKPHSLSKWLHEISRITITSNLSEIPDEPSTICETAFDTTQSDYEIIRQSVEDAIPNCTVHIYGSCLYMTNPDNKPTELDLHIEFGVSKQHGSIHKRKSTKESIVQHLKTYNSQKYPTRWENVVRDSQNVMEPVIRAVDVTSGMKCKLSFSSQHFVETGKRLKMFIDTVPMIQIMIDCLKNWQTYSSGFQFSTYQLTILVIWYFQYREYVASVRIYQNVNYFKGAQINFNEPPKILKLVNGDVCYHLFDFFHFFGNQYSPENTILCPYYGKLFIRHGFVLMDPENQKLVDMIDNAASQQWDQPHAFMYVSDIILQKQCPNVMVNISESAVQAFQTEARGMVSVMIGDGMRHIQHIL